ncbi:MAG: hypothetical protein WCI52_01615 [bacterium]
MKIKKYFCAVLSTLLVSLSFVSHQALASTIVASNIVSDTTWTKENSPYLVPADLQVASGTTLTINAGVSVLFATSTSARLVVFGHLKSAGTVSGPILFSSVATLPGSTPRIGDWVGLNFAEGATGDFSFTTISYALTGTMFQNGVNTLSNVSFLHNGNAFSVFGGKITATNIISDDTNDQNAIMAFAPAELNILNATTTNVGDSFALAIYNASTSISHAVFSGGNNSGIGLYGARTNLQDVSVSGFSGDGLQVFDSNGTSTVANVSDSQFKSNAGFGVRVFDPSPKLLVSSSLIFGNARGGVVNYSSNLIDARSNFWGDVSGPYNANQNATGTGNSVSKNVQFSPWLSEFPPIPVGPAGCCSNIIFFPGIEASRLYNTENNQEKRLWEPGVFSSSATMKLSLDSNGDSTDSTIHTKDILKKTDIFGPMDQDIYQKFSDDLDGLKSSKKINAWEAIPYDWRLDLNKTIDDGIKNSNGSVTNIIDELHKIASSSKTGKVTLVSHSNGGLLIKLLIAKLAEKKNTTGDKTVDLIDKVIMVATPQIGTPMAVGALLHGDDQDIAGGVVLSAKTARTIGQNMSGVYSLLPSSAYFSTVKNPIVTFDQSVKDIMNASSYGDSITTISKLQSFLLAKNDKRKIPTTGDLVDPAVLNSKILKDANDIHSLIDDLYFPASTTVYKIAGIGVDTTQGISYKSDGYSSFKHDLNKTIMGDGTVVDSSALYGDGQGYHVNLYQKMLDSKKTYTHQNIMEMPEVETLINNLVKGDDSAVTYVSKIRDNLNSKTLQISSHSPISLNIYDNQGRHVGPSTHASSTSDVNFYDEEIPGSHYYEIGEEKYAILPVGGYYTVAMQGLGIGNFTLNQATYADDVKINSADFVDLPVTPMTEASLVINSTSTDSVGTSNLSIDSNGDGKPDLNIAPTPSSSPLVVLQNLKNVIATFGLKIKVQDEIFMKIDRLADLIKKNKIKQADKRLKIYLNQMSKINWHKKAVTADIKNIIIDNLNNILEDLQS